MTMTMLELTCRDPVVSRDGRPFGANQGNRMRSAGWPLPSVVAGSLRTAIGKAAGKEFSDATAQELLQVSVAGVLPTADGKLYLPAPNDCIVHPDRGPLRAAPERIQGVGCDWPDNKEMQPVMLSTSDAPEDFKPQAGPAWWPVDCYAEWLAGHPIVLDKRFLLAPSPDERTHVQLDAKTGTADEGRLFTTSALPLTHLARFRPGLNAEFADRYAEIVLTARVSADDWCSQATARLDTLHPLGGERRLVYWKAVAASMWSCPNTLVSVLANAKRIRMALATPAILAGGWKPGTMNDDLQWTPPGADVTLQLVGASMQRWRAVSGWSMAHLPNQPRGPKPVKRFVPAGGVYFFEVVGGSAADLATRWLEPISDNEQDRRDGLGLATWGVW